MSSFPPIITSTVCAAPPSPAAVPPSSPTGPVRATAPVFVDQIRRQQDRSAVQSHLTTPFAANGVCLAPPRSAAPAQQAGVVAADEQLRSIQQGAVTSAHREIARGVREVGGDNRGPDVERYHQVAGTAPGQQWCGAFAAFNLQQGAATSGRRFTGAAAMASDRKAENFFMYRDSTSGTVDTARRTSDSTSGNSRHYMTLQGSDGDHYARDHGLPHDTYASALDLPLRPGDIVVMQGHVAMVDRFDPHTGRLEIVEGNAGRNTDRATRRALNVNSAEIRGFGRPSLNDFQPTPSRE